MFFHLDTLGVSRVFNKLPHYCSRSRETNLDVVHNIGRDGKSIAALISEDKIARCSQEWYGHKRYFEKKTGQSGDSAVNNSMLF